MSLTKKLLFIAFSSFILIGCATPYQELTPMTLTGGYYTNTLPTGEYKVGFSGNGYTDTTTALDYALLRCSEVAIAHNKKYFEIVQGSGGRVDEAYWTGYGIDYASKPNAEYIIRLHNKKTSKIEGKLYNATETRDLMRKRHNLDDNNQVKKETKTTTQTPTSSK